MYKRSRVTALDHPWWKHSTGVSKRWPFKLYSFKTRVVSNLAWLTTWLLRELLSIPLHLLFVKTLEHAKVLRLGYQAICLLVRCNEQKNLSFQFKENSLTLTSTICTFMQITFQGIRGSSYTGDIAIDDVSLMDGFCTGKDCYFDSTNRRQKVV